MAAFIDYMHLHEWRWSAIRFEVELCPLGGGDGEGKGPTFWDTLGHLNEYAPRVAKLWLATMPNKIWSAEASISWRSGNTALALALHLHRLKIEQALYAS